MGFLGFRFWGFVLFDVRQPASRFILRGANGPNLAKLWPNNMGHMGQPFVGWRPFWITRTPKRRTNTHSGGKYACSLGHSPNCCHEKGVAGWPFQCHWTRKFLTMAQGYLLLTHSHMARIAMCPQTSPAVATEILCDWVVSMVPKRRGFRCFLTRR